MKYAVKTHHSLVSQYVLFKAQFMFFCLVQGKEHSSALPVVYLH